MTEVILDYGSRTSLGEGIFYNHLKGQLIWTDITGHRILRYSFGARRLTEWKVDHLGKFPSAIWPVSDQTQASQNIKHQYLVSFQNSLELWDPISNQCQQVLVLEPDVMEPSFRFNDGKCDPMGRLWIGTMDLYDRPNRGGLYKLTPEGNLEKRLDCSLSNGLGWSPDGSRMYYIDTPERKVQIFEYNLELGEIIGQLDEIDLSGEEGKPDGMTVDADGNLWIAMWDGSQMIHVDPNHKTVQDRIKLSVSRPTNCAIGGPNLNQLLVTSAMVEGEPNSGRIILVAPTFGQIGGIPCNHWAF